MYNNISYEEYMRTVLGYQPGNIQCGCSMDDYYIMPSCEQFYNETMQNNSEADKLYPEIYVKIYPTVCKICSQCTSQINGETLERMADEVYDMVLVADVRKEEKKEIRQRDNALRDLIKILILREIFGPGFPNPRPPRPPRPPFPGPNPRPPMPPRPPRPPYPGPGPR